MRTVSVDLRNRSYPISIGAGARGELVNLVHEQRPGTRVAVIADRRVADLHLERVLDGLDDTPTVLTFPAGEASKSLAQMDQLYDGLAKALITRQDLVVTLGGGVAGDLGGFVAATWMRGVRYVQMPTTLLAAIDASVGGKTGVNHSAGKNLIGAFHQPIAVIVDTNFLETLPRRDYVAGLGESIKHAVIRDAAFFEWHERHIDDINDSDAETLEYLIARNCEIKAEVVAQDEREEDLRMILNHGHTIGHAIEHVLNYELRHGECVALGMLVENAIACRRGILSPAIADRVSELIGRLRLPTHLPRAAPPDDVIAACWLDKKVRRGEMNFVFVGGLGAPQRATDVSTEEIATALRIVQPG